MSEYRLTSTPRSGMALAILTTIAMSGCAQSPSRSLARVWNEMPRVHWTRVPDTPPAKPSTESKLAAKSPEKETSEIKRGTFSQYRTAKKKTVDQSSLEDDPKFAAHSRAKNGPHDPFADDVPSTAQPVAKRKLIPPQTDPAEEPQVVSARDRLRATLTDDARRNQAPETDSGHQERLRLRVESLMSRAQHLYEEQEWTQAKRAAELAQSLAESSGLEFAPDEERPIDLLALINSRLDTDIAQTVAESEVEAELDQDATAAADRVDKAEAVPKRRLPFAEKFPFDPYEPQQVTLAKLDADGNPLEFGPSMVVLDSPSFGDEPEVRPMAYTRNSSRRKISERMAKLKGFDPPELEHEELVIPSDAEDMLSEPTDQQTEEEIELSALSEIEESLADEQNIAPSPPLEVELDGPELKPQTPRIELADDSDPTSTSTEDAEADAEIQPASAIPRWMPLSLLSLLTAGFCVWLWRRRQLAAE